MEQITSDLRAGDSTPLEPALRAKILQSVENEAPGEGRRPLPRRIRPAEAVAVAATVLLLGAVISPVFMQAREKSRSVNAVAPAPALPADARRSEAAPSAGGIEAVRVSAQPGPPVRLDSASAGTTAVPLARRVKKEASIHVAVTGLEAKSDAVEEMVKTAGGFVANHQLTTAGDGGRSAELTVKVPVGQFETILTRISKLGEVTAKNVTGEDITEQVSDERQAARVLQNEIRYKEERLKRGGDTFYQRQQEQEARQLRIELAQTQARLELLEKMAALATIAVQLVEKETAAGGFLGEMGDTAHFAADSFAQAARLPFLLLIWVVAYAPLWIPLLLAYRWAVRVQERRTGKPPLRDTPPARGEKAHPA